MDGGGDLLGHFYMPPGEGKKHLAEADYYRCLWASSWEPYDYDSVYKMPVETGYRGVWVRRNRNESLGINVTEPLVIPSK